MRRKCGRGEESEADTGREAREKPRRNDSPVPVGPGCIFILLNSLPVALTENQLAWASLTGTCVLRPKALTQIVLITEPERTPSFGCNPEILDWSHRPQAFTWLLYPSVRLGLFTRWTGRPPTFCGLHSLLSGALSSIEEPTPLFELT